MFVSHKSIMCFRKHQGNHIVLPSSEVLVKKVSMRDSLDGRGESGRRLGLDWRDWWVRHVMDGSESLRSGEEQYLFSVTLRPISIMRWDKQQQQQRVVVVLLWAATKHAKSVQMRVAWPRSHDWPSSGSLWKHTKMYVKAQTHKHIFPLVTACSLCIG